MLSLYKYSLKVHRSFPKPILLAIGVLWVLGWWWCLWGLIYNDIPRTVPGHQAQEVYTVTISMVLTHGPKGCWPQPYLYRLQMHNSLLAAAICFQAFLYSSEFLPVIESPSNDSDTILNRLQMIPQWKRWYTIKHNVSWGAWGFALFLVSHVFNHLGDNYNVILFCHHN